MTPTTPNGCCLVNSQTTTAAANNAAGAGATLAHNQQHSNYQHLITNNNSFNSTTVVDSQRPTVTSFTNEIKTNFMSKLVLNREQQQLSSSNSISHPRVLNAIEHTKLIEPTTTATTSRIGDASSSESLIVKNVRCEQQHSLIDENGETTPILQPTTTTTAVTNPSTSSSRVVCSPNVMVTDMTTSKRKSSSKLPQLAQQQQQTHSSSSVYLHSNSSDVSSTTAGTHHHNGDDEVLLHHNHHHHNYHHHNHQVNGSSSAHSTNSLNDLRSKFESINQLGQTSTINNNNNNNSGTTLVMRNHLTSTVASNNSLSTNATSSSRLSNSQTAAIFGHARSSFTSASHQYFSGQQSNDQTQKPTLSTANNACSNESSIRSSASASASSTTLSSSNSGHKIMTNKCVASWGEPTNETVVTSAVVVAPTSSSRTSLHANPFTTSATMVNNLELSSSPNRNTVINLLETESSNDHLISHSSSPKLVADSMAAAAAACNAQARPASCLVNGGLVSLKQHSAKCNVMLRKMRRGNKRSKSVPSKFNIDSVLEYLNYSMILNKYELRKHLNQQRNLIFTHHNYNSYNTINSNTTNTNTNNNPLSSNASSAQSSQQHQQQQQQQASSSMACCPLNTTSTTNARLSLIRSKLSSNPPPPACVYQHQFSSGYNSENHSNSSQCTTATTAHTHMGASNYRASSSSSHNNDEYLALFNFYRLTLNHLPANFSNTLCTCSAATSGANLTEPNGGHNNRKSSSKPSPSNNPVSSSPIIGNDDDDLDEDDFDDEDEDLDEDMMMDEYDVDTSPGLQQHNSSKVSPTPISSSNIIVNHNQQRSKSPAAVVVQGTPVSARPLSPSRDRLRMDNHEPWPMPICRFHRAPGTSVCPHTAKIDIRRARSYQDLTQAQKLYTLDDFVFKEKLGEGFFANVKKIVSKSTNQEMVLKELKLGSVETGVDADSSEVSSSLSLSSKTFNYAELHAAHKSFLKEAQVLRNLNHPNVIKLLGILFTKQKHLNLVLEYIGGGTLKDIIHNISIGLPWKLRVGYARDIAAAMQYLHSLNIIHRDLKSDNCLVRENGRSVVVADFGLSRIINQSWTSSSSSSNTSTSAAIKRAVANRNCDDSFLKLQNNNYNNSMLTSGNLSGIAHTPVQSGTNSFIVAAKRKLKRRGENHPRKQRYAVVGNSFSMAPEMLKHELYDERVDIFSFGIICCEIIGRVQADPDYLPRTSDFGLNVELFRKKYCEADCPKHFIKIAIACCELEPEKRPPFVKTHVWLETILGHLETNNPIPKNLLKNILESNTKRPSIVVSASNLIN